MSEGPHHIQSPDGEKIELNEVSREEPEMHDAPCDGSGPIPLVPGDATPENVQMQTL